MIQEKESLMHETLGHTNNFRVFDQCVSDVLDHIVETLYWKVGFGDVGNITPLQLLRLLRRRCHTRIYMRYVALLNPQSWIPLMKMEGEFRIEWPTCEQPAEAHIIYGSASSFYGIDADWQHYVVTYSRDGSVYDGFLRIYPEYTQRELTEIPLDAYYKGATSIIEIGLR